MLPLVVLYEDKLSKDARSPNGYIPHQFLMRCVADRPGMPDGWELGRRVKAVPLNGVGRIKAVLRSPAMFRPRGESLLFVADADVIHDHFGMGRLESTEMCEAILASLPDRTSITLFLLVDNMESLVNAAAQVLGRPIPDKSHTTRDMILGALLDPSKAGERLQVVDRVSMLPQIIDRLVQLVSVHLPHT